MVNPQNFLVYWLQVVPLNNIFPIPHPQLLVTTIVLWVGHYSLKLGCNFYLNDYINTVWIYTGKI